MNELKRVLPYVRPYRKAVVVGLLMVVVSNAFTLAGPYLMKLAIDGLGEPNVTSRRIAVYAGLIILAALLGGAAKFGMREIMNGTSRRIERDLRDDFFAHLLRLDAPFFARLRTGDLMSRATNDTLAVRMATGPAVMYAVNTTVSFVFSLSLMLWISPGLTAVSLLPMLIIPPIVIGVGKVIHRRYEAIQEQLSTLSTMVQENLTGLRIVRAYVQEEEQENRFHELNAEYLQRNMGLVRASGFFFPLLMLIAGSAMVIVLWFGGNQVMQGIITVGDFIAFTFYLALLTWPMIALGWVINLFQRGAASMGRLNRIFDTSPEVSPPHDPAPFQSVDGGLEFRDVTFRYPGTEREVLRNVSFSVRPGETVAVVGSTGSGKSTLVSLIPRLFDPTDGEILLDGTPLSRLDLEGLRRAIGFVPQDSFLFSDTILRNIGLGLTEDREPGTSPGSAEVRRDGKADPGDRDAGTETGNDLPRNDLHRNRIQDSAEIAQIHEAILTFPDGYDTILGERGINLSGGQKQRATLARALARNPGILILDDALSAVDTQTEARILQDLRTALAGRTAFIISHRVSAVMEADQILVLEEGQIVERGTHDALLARGGVYANLLRRQLLEEELRTESVAS